MSAAYTPIVDLLNRLRSLLRGRPASTPLSPRHERREAARQHHRETGEPLWTADDRHLNEDGSHVAADVAPGTPGHFGSVHSVRDD